MALIVEDSIVETSTTTGTGALTLAGPVTGFRAFSAVMTSPSDTCYYLIEGIDGSGNRTGEWETGLGTYSGANTLTRTTPQRSSNSNAAVSFSAGTKRVMICATRTYLTGLAPVEATASQIWTGTSSIVQITPAAMFAALTSISLTDAATITPDFNTGFNFHVTLGGNRTLANPTNAKAGQGGRIRVTQDGTGTRTLAFGANWLFPGGDPTLSTAAGAIDIISYYCHSSSSIEASCIKALS
jgi:hypothetical protein